MISGNTIEGFENGDNMDVNATSNSIVSGAEPNNEQSEPNAAVGTTEDSGAIDSTNSTEATDTTSVAATAGSSNNGEVESEGEGDVVNGNVESRQNNMKTQELSLVSEPIKHYDECVVNNIPLQKWVNLVVSQYNQTMDIYLDGQLVSSCVLKGFPEVREEGVSICPDGGFEGSISRLAFYNNRN